MLRSMSLDRKNSMTSSNNTNSNNELNDYRCYSVHDDLSHRTVKKQKQEHKTIEIVVEVSFTTGEKYVLRALLDSGTTATMLLKICRTLY